MTRSIEARPCTPAPNISNATAIASNGSQAINGTGNSSASSLLLQNMTTSSNGTNSTNETSTTEAAEEVTTTAIPSTTPAPLCLSLTGCNDLPTPPPAHSLDLDDVPTPPPITPPPIVDQALGTKDQVTSELGLLNSTIYNTLRQDMFAGLTLPEEANSILAASLIIAGVVSCFMGHRYMKVTVSFVAFCAGSVASMYPIDKVLGGTLCGEYACAAGVPDDLFCQWSFVSGMGVGLVCGGMAMRLIDAGSVIMGASIGLLVGLLFQPAVDQMLATANTPGWSHFLHYILFFGAGAGLGKMHPVALQISMSAVMGSMMAGSGLSFFADGALSPAAMMSGQPIDCGSGCIGICCGAVVLAFVGMFFQQRMHKRKKDSESGELAEAKLEETLGATLKLVEKVREREERVEREESRRRGGGNDNIYPDLDSRSRSDDRV
jgi:membrane protein implicated in regulation of membrane protease activity